MIEFLAVLWCRTFHDNISRPVGNYYVCFECGRRYRTPWATETERGVYEQR
jgi:hypothetical protein